MARRATRPRPHLDDKVLTAWNGLMIAAFARAARTIDGGGQYLHDGQTGRAFSSESTSGSPSSGTLLRRYREGEAGVDGYAEDYAYLIFGLLELFQADGDPAVAGVGDRSFRRGRTSCSGIPSTAAGSARPGRTNRCCCASRRTTTAPSRPPAP